MDDDSCHKEAQKEAQTCHSSDISLTIPLRSIPHVTIMMIENQEGHPSVGRRGAVSPSSEDAPDCKRLRLEGSNDLFGENQCDDFDRMACGECCQP